MWACRPSAFVLLLICGQVVLSQELPFMRFARVDPKKVVTAEVCGECHIAAYEVWKKTPHATTFKTLHRTERAEAIAKKLGFRLIKRDSFCFSCHYTAVVRDGNIRVVSGVSCESCHGAAAQWIDVHNDYGEGFDHRSETAQHKISRIEGSRRAGMRRPSDLYPVAANCFSCHTVPNERLVNVGGHTTGSNGFEFVKWSQGEIRHNFLASFRAGGGGTNEERPVARQRLMYFVGRALDLEYSLRGVAAANEEGVYAKAMARRSRASLAEMRAIDSSAAVPEVAKMFNLVRGVKVVPGNKSALLAAADEIGRLTRAFLAQHDGNRLAGLDPLLLGTEQLVDKVEGLQPPAETAAATGAETDAAPRSDVVIPSGKEASPVAAPKGAGVRSSPSDPASRVVSRIKRRIRPRSAHRTLGPGACSGCHRPQNEWWFGHNHYRSADPFFEGEPKNLQIARLYGISPAEMTKGTQICMDCHGTVISGKESREVLDGVSCESCHGAAGEWLEPHKDETDKHLGRKRPGHLRALQLGKADPGDLEVRARACTGCHYITEPRLLSAGHPAGVGFDFIRGMTAVRHWENAVTPTDLRAAFASVLAERGPVPNVQVVRLEPERADAAVSRASSPGAKPGAHAAAREQSAAERQTAAGLRPPTPRPADILSLPADGLSESPARPLFPEIDEASSIEDILLILAERLKMLYRRVASQSPGGRL